VFAPQKGASPAEVVQLEAGLARFAAALPAAVDATVIPGAGAAGGTGYGFIAAWGAAIESGARAIAELTGLAAAVASADVVITGEGRFDASSSTGKVVGNLLSLIDAAGPRAAVVAGSLDAEPVTPAGRPVWSASLTELAGSRERALDDPIAWLYAAGIAAAQALGDD
jgi:glycerate kinase